MIGVPYVAEITATTGRRAVSLGGVTMANRRLALRWLRWQALRLANGSGAPEPPPTGARDVQPITFRGPAAPNGLRAWAEDPDQQDQAIGLLESGCPDLLTVFDPAAGLLVTLAGWPLRSARAVGD
ncbi:hypothetical protein OHA41_12515 [Streptomyces sp. NBC_00342]